MFVSPFICLVIKSTEETFRSPLNPPLCQTQARSYVSIFISTSKLRSLAHKCLRTGVGDHTIPSSFIFSSTYLAISCIPLTVG
jgi:hypothetical protein